MNIGSVGSAGSAWATQMQRGQGAQRTEGAQGMEELFAQIDSDGDGNVTQGEFEAFKPTESSDSAAASTASSFNVEMSTSQFAAQMGGGGHGGRGMHGAGGPPPGPPPSLSERDSDDDGSISAEEFGIGSDSTATQDAKATELFSRIDSDGSGELSSEEVEAFESMMAEQRTQGPGGGDPLATLDADEDGSVSAEEFGLEDATAQMQQLFKAIDGDEDGSLSTEELKSFQEQMQAMQAQHYAQVAANGVTADATVVSTTA